MRDPIVIVGGGLSGLYAARLLQERGAEFLLLEARARLGGRVLSPGGHDLGPTWFWPDMQPRVTRLVERLGLEAFAQHAAGDVLFERGLQVERYPGFGQMNSSFRIRGGIGALVNALAAGLPPERIRTGVQVTKAYLREGGVGVIARGADGGACEIAARHLLFALPPRLIEQQIGFAPELPPALRSRWRGTPTWMAAHAKFVAVYARPFWREKGLCGTAHSMAGPMVEIHDASLTAHGEGAALFGFLGVTGAGRALAGEGALSRQGLAQLVRLFGPEASTPMTIHFKDWSADPFTATAADAEAGGHPEPQSRAWFNPAWSRYATMAGSEVAREHPGYLEGALCAAEGALLQAGEAL